MYLLELLMEDNCLLHHVETCITMAISWHYTQISGWFMFLLRHFGAGYDCGPHDFLFFLKIHEVSGIWAMQTINVSKGVETLTE